jgi:hypothetical protein
MMNATAVNTAASRSDRASSADQVFRILQVPLVAALSVPNES